MAKDGYQTLTIPEETDAQLEAMVGAGMYRYKSEAVQKLVRRSYKRSNLG